MPYSRENAFSIFFSTTKLETLPKQYSITLSLLPKQQSAALLHSEGILSPRAPASPCGNERLTSRRDQERPCWPGAATAVTAAL